MAVTGNIVTNIGDVLNIFIDIFVDAKSIAITGYTEVTNGEDSDQFFVKKFRYTSDLINYSDWQLLNNENVTAISEKLLNNALRFELRYERAGISETTPLEFVSIEFTYTVVSNERSTPTLDSSCFKDFIFSNQENISLSNNLFEKVYGSQILAEYVSRQLELKSDEDDLRAFWLTNCLYFSMFITFAKNYQNIISNVSFLKEFLSQKKIAISEFEDSLSNLQYISNNFLQEVRKRGTFLIFKRKDDIIVRPNENKDVQIDGEFVRLISNEYLDELMYSVSSRTNTGFCLGWHSPLYRGFRRNVDFVKGYELESSVQSLSNYPTLNETYMTIFDDDVHQWIKIDELPVGQECGIALDAEDFTPEKCFVVDENLNYEVTFILRQSDVENIILDFGIDCYDKLGNSKNVKKIDNSSNSKFFLQDFSIRRNDIEVCVRGFIASKNYASITNTSSNFLTNVGAGSNLRLNNSGINLISPFLIFKNVGSADSGPILIRDFKVRLSSSRYSHGFLNSPNFIQIFAKNRSKVLSEEQINEFVKSKLLPYNSFSEITLI